MVNGALIDVGSVDLYTLLDIVRSEVGPYRPCDAMPLWPFNHVSPVIFCLR